MAVNQNVEAERFLLGCIILDNTIIKELRVRPDHFYEPTGQAIYSAMQRLEEKGDPIDVVSLYTELGTMASVEDLSRLSQAVPSKENYRQYEKYVIDSWKQRRANEAAKTFLDTDDDERIKDLYEKLATLDEQFIETGNFSMKETLVEIYNEAETNDKEIQGIPTGYQDLDDLTSGNQKGDLIIVAARPSMGKTAYALNVALGHIKNNAYGHIYSLEMPKKQLVKRMISAKGNIDATKLRSPKLFFDEADWKNFTDTLNVLNYYEDSVYIEDRPFITVQEIYANTRKIMRENPDKDHFVMIDYLQLLQSSKNKPNRNDEVSDISRNLKAMALDLDIPVIALSQLSRGVESRQDKRPMLSDLRESGSIEQDADRVEFLYRDDYYDAESERTNITEIIVAKHRNGPIGVVELAFIKEYNKFLNLDRRFGEDGGYNG